jgi:membrane protein DedA with SNARE-associated domain
MRRGRGGSDDPGVFESAFDLLSESPEAYLIVFALALGDGIFPAFPSETGLILAGLLSVVGELQLGWVIAAGAAGAFAGDSVSYGLGRFVGRPAQKRFLDGRRARAALEWASGQLQTRGGTVVIVGRYIPGGRTAATFTAGLTHYPYGKFLAFDAVAAITWAAYASLLGYFGGRFFHDHVWAALLLAFGAAIAVALAIEGVRRLRR